MSRTLHILHGWSVAGCFKQAFHPNSEDLLVNDDVLSCGPLPPFQSPEQWATVRGAYWESVARDDYPSSNFNSDFVSGLLSLGDDDSLVFWLGTGVAEQLLLAWAVHLLTLSGTRANVGVVQFTRVAKNGMDVWGLGLLHPEQIMQHPPVEQLSAEAIAELGIYWAAVTSPDPTQLLSVLAHSPTHCPHLRASLKRCVLRYPDLETGLGRWDYELLKEAQHLGPRVVRVIGEVMGCNFDADLVGDDYLLSRLRRMAATDVAHPLVALPGDPNNMRQCEVALTDVGRQVLAGHANAVELNGIDDWILGVHLDSSRGTLWYHKNGKLIPG